MKYTAQLECEDGEFVASCPELEVSAHGLSAGNALDALRRNIRFHVELCPCSTVEEEWIEMDVQR